MVRIGIVVIGRNEGERLCRCLRSVNPQAHPTVYVDSGSTDGSPDQARALGAFVVLLDDSRPWTAARARNEGFAHLLAIAPTVKFVQFIDGDCELVPGWLEAGVAALQADPRVVVVCGRRRERFPDASIYNRLCDLEWDTPVGPTEACGGDALMRVEAVKAVGGYRADLIAGEEPELCLRLRAAGGTILRLAAEMTLHDANMTRFRQWWKRNVRAGHAYAEVASLHRRSPWRIWRRSVLSNWFWGACLPIVALGGAYWTFGASLTLLCGYAILYLRVKRARRARGDRPADAALYARYCVLGKFPQMLGQVRFHLRRALGRRPRLIEYKTAPVYA